MNGEMRQTIEQDGINFKIAGSIKPVIGKSQTIVHTFVADGETVAFDKAINGDPIGWLPSIKGDTFVMEANTPYGKESRESLGGYSPTSYEIACSTRARYGQRIGSRLSLSTLDLNSPQKRNRGNSISVWVGV